MLRLWNFPRHSNITLALTLPCDDVKKEKKFCSVNFTSLLLLCRFFSSLMLWVTVFVSVSAAFQAQRECEGEIEMVYRLLFVFICLSLHVFRMELEFFFQKDVEGREISVKTLFSLIFFFAYNNVRAFKWRDIYRIIVKLVRCFSEALVGFFFLSFS